MTGFETYLFLKLDTISSGVVFVGIFVMLLALMLAVIFADNESISFSAKLKRFVIPFVFGMLVIFMGVMVPSTKEAMIIYAVPTISEYVKNSKELKELPDNVVKTANEWVTNFRPDSITTSAKEFIEIIKK